MIVIYNQTKHQEYLQLVLKHDTNGSIICGLNGLFIEESPDYRELKLVFERSQDNLPIGYLEGKVNSQSKIATISVIYVVESERGNGISKQLLEQFENYYKDRFGVDTFNCNIYDTNEASINFFKKNGYIQTGYREKIDRIGTKYLNLYTYSKFIENSI